MLYFGSIKKKKNCGYITRSFVTVARKWVKVNCVRWVRKSLGKMNINVGKGVSEMINENGR